MKPFNHNFFTDQGILERHNQLNSTIGVLKMENEALQTATLFSWIFFPLWIVLTVFQAICFILFNGKLHPLEQILTEGKDC